MIIYGGQELARLRKSLPDPEQPEEEGNQMDDYEKLNTKLSGYYLLKIEKHHAWYVFLKMKPQHGESTASYAARLHRKANECDFGKTCKDRILAHLVQTIENQFLVQKTISKTWNLTQFLKEASEMEDMSMQICDMRHATGEQQVDLVRKHAPHKWKPNIHKGKPQNEDHRTV